MQVFYNNAKKFARNTQISLKERWETLKTVSKRVYEYIWNLFQKTLRVIVSLATSVGRFLKDLFFKIIYSPVFWCVTFSFSIALLYKVVAEYGLTPLFFYKASGNDFLTMRNFIDWLGIPYSFLISTALVRAWERADDVSTGLRKEAYSIVILVDTVQSVAQKFQLDCLEESEQIISAIAKYVSHVDSLFNLEYEDLKTKHEGDERIKNIERDIILKLGALPEFNDLKLSQKISDLVAARKDRLFSSKGRMPSIMWMLLLVSSILWLTLFVSVHFDSIMVGFGLMFGLSFIVSTVIVTILLFNEPTSIRWNDISHSWRKLQARISSGNRSEESI